MSKMSKTLMSSIYISNQSSISIMSISIECIQDWQRVTDGTRLSFDKMRARQEVDDTVQSSFVGAENGNSGKETFETCSASSMSPFPSNIGE